MPTIKCFNSLQVDYQPCRRCSYTSYCFEFQFLIGRLSTFIHCFLWCWDIRFNSLQVDYQLDGYIQLKAEATKVSIPYRQTINVLIGGLGMGMILSFNSLQVDYQLFRSYTADFKPFSVSIPYRQTINCRQAVTYRKYADSFNSLQVDYQQ